MSILRASALRIQRRVDPLLAGATSPPVDVETIAVNLGAEVRALEIADDLCGILYWEGERRVLVVNAAQTVARRRVSIARQLGFLSLHRRAPVRVDTGLRVDLRQPMAGTAATIEDVEANVFALHLLLPEAWLRSDLGSDPLDFADEVAMAALAERYRVPITVLALRILTLDG